jgi:hypothetical protein
MKERIKNTKKTYHFLLEIRVVEEEMKVEEIQEEVMSYLQTRMNKEARE